MLAVAVPGVPCRGEGGEGSSRGRVVGMAAMFPAAAAAHLRGMEAFPEEV